MQVKMKVSVFGLEKDCVYPAERIKDKDALLVTNGTFKGVVLNEDVEVVE